MGYIGLTKRALQASDPNVRAENVDAASGVGEKAPVRLSTRLPLDEPAVIGRYVTVYGGVRVGRLLEDIDAFGAQIAYHHCDGFSSARPLTVVTGAVDRVMLQRSLKPGTAAVLEGEMSYVGTSSMEVAVRLRAECDSESAIECKMTFVAKDKTTGAPARVHRLKVTSDAEQAAFELGRQNAARRREASRQNLINEPPKSDEIEIVHDLFKMKRNPALSQTNWTSLADTSFSSTLLMHPEQKNIHGAIFGGHLMRYAYELGYATASVFLKGRPDLTVIDEIFFLHPVNIGAVLNLNATVVYKHKESVVIQVHARVLDVATGSHLTTNTFYLTFHANNPRSSVPDLMPDSFEEAMVYLEGRRRFLRTSHQQ